MDARLLETTCQVALAVDEDRAHRAADALVEVAGRCGMRELLVQGLLHQAALGRPASADLAQELERHLEVAVDRRSWSDQPSATTPAATTPTISSMT